MISVLGVESKPESTLRMQIAELAVVGDFYTGSRLPTRLHEVTIATHALSIPPGARLTICVCWALGSDMTNITRP